MGSNPAKVFPHEAFLEQLRKYAFYAAFVGTMLIPMLFADIDSMPDMDILAENDNILEDFSQYMPRVSENSKMKYNARIVAFFDDMARLGYI